MEIVTGISIGRHFPIGDLTMVTKCGQELPGREVFGEVRASSQVGQVMREHCGEAGVGRGRRCMDLGHGSRDECAERPEECALPFIGQLPELRRRSTGAPCTAVEVPVRIASTISESLRPARIAVRAIQYSTCEPSSRVSAVGLSWTWSPLTTPASSRSSSATRALRTGTFVSRSKRDVRDTPAKSLSASQR